MILAKIALIASMVGLLLTSSLARGETWVDEMNKTDYKSEKVLTSYHYKEDSTWTTWNKVWFSSAIGLYGVGDTLSTVDALDRGCSESNPLVGDDPATGTLILVKVAAFGLIWWLVEHVTPEENRQDMRNNAYGFLSIAGGAVTAHNFNLECN